MTEVPLTQPKIIQIGAGADSFGGWVNLGYPRRTPLELALPKISQPLTPEIDFYPELTIKFRASDLAAFSQETELQLKAYLVFTGEPHLVVFPDSDFSIPELADYIFGSSEQWSVKDRRESFGTWLVEHIGKYMNGRFKELFPSGINVNLARSIKTDVIENRCFERGINRETLACGTGALAVAYVYSHLNQMDLDEIDILPHRCRWHDDDAKISIHRTSEGWRLASSPVMLFDGHYRLLPASNRLVSALGQQSSPQGVDNEISAG